MEPATRRRRRLVVVLGLVALASSSGRVNASTTKAAAAAWDLAEHASDIAAAKREFLALQPDPAVYGYDGLLDKIRAEDTPQMAGQVYLDWTVRRPR